MSNHKAMWSYRRDECDDRIYLIRDEETIQQEYKKIGLIYLNNNGSCSVLKHGDFDSVLSYMEKSINKLNQAGLYEMSSEMVFIDITGANMDDLNFVLERSALSEHHFQKLNAIDVEIVKPDNSIGILN